MRLGSGVSGQRNPLQTGVILSYLHMTLQVVVGLLYTPIMLRLLGQVEYGLYALVASIVSYVGLLSFGFGGAYLRFHSRMLIEGGAEQVARLNGVFMTIFTMLGLVAGGLGGLMAANVDAILGDRFASAELDVARVLMWILSLNIAVTFPTTVFNSYIVAHERFSVQKIVAIAQTLTNPIIVLTLLSGGFGAIALALSTITVGVLASVYLSWYCFRHLSMRITFRNFQFSVVREVIGFSGPIFVYMVVDQILWQVNKLVVGRSHGPSEVAIYGVAALLATYYMDLAGVLSRVFEPRVNRMVAGGSSDAHLTELFIRVGRLQFIVQALFLTGLIFIGPSFLVLWAGEEYAPSYVVLLLLILPVSIPLLQNIGVEVQKAKNLLAFRARVDVIAAVASLALAIPLAQAFGAAGAAAATGFCILSARGFVLNWYYHARVGLNVRRFWFQMLSFTPALVLPTFVGLIVLLSGVAANPAGLAAAVAALTLAYLGSMWVLGMNSGERDLVRAILRSRQF